MKRVSGFPALSALLLLAIVGCGGGGERDVTGDAPDDSGSPAGPDDDAGGADTDSPAADATASGVGESPFDVGAPDASDDAAIETPFAGGDAPPMGDDGPDLQAPVGDGDDTDSLIGLWDYTRTTDRGVDVALFLIEAGGIVTEYDYRNDAPGDGRDCHLVSTALIASRGNDRYDIQSSSILPGSNGIDDVLITAGNGEITFRYLGDVFDPEFGNGQTGITETYPAATERRVEELAICGA